MLSLLLLDTSPASHGLHSSPDANFFLPLSCPTQSFPPNAPFRSALRNDLHQRTRALYRSSVKIARPARRDIVFFSLSLISHPPPRHDNGFSEIRTMHRNAQRVVANVPAADVAATDLSMPSARSTTASSAKSGGRDVVMVPSSYSRTSEGGGTKRTGMNGIGRETRPRSGANSVPPSRGEARRGEGGNSSSPFKCTGQYPPAFALSAASTALLHPSTMRSCIARPSSTYARLGPTSR